MVLPQTLIAVPGAAMLAVLNVILPVAPSMLMVIDVAPLLASHAPLV